MIQIRKAYAPTNNSANRGTRWPAIRSIGRFAFPLIVLLILNTLPGCRSLPEKPPATVSKVNLQQYTGLWYEIARLPVPFQKADELAMAEYTLNKEGSIDLVNTAIAPDGTQRSVSGNAVPVEGSNNSKLKVSINNFFAKLFGSSPDYGNYWILKLDPDYQVALVGSPHRDTLWLLARDPEISGETLDRYISHAREAGYPVSRLLINNGKFAARLPAGGNG